MELPFFGDKVQPLVTKLPYVRTKEVRYIPHPDYAEFWEAVYLAIQKHINFSSPLRSPIDDKINPYFGFFGYRWDPSTYAPQSFHTGIDIEGRRKTGVRAMADGILEYSGYGVINGNYVMISHPDIVSEDGYVLHGLYMHLRDVSVKFSSYQKMLREISLRTYPRVPIAKEQLIGTIGGSGETSYPKGYVHMHLQLEFRNKEGKSIYIDPARAMGLSIHENLTSTINSKKEFADLYVRNRKDIFQRKLEPIWAPYVKPPHD